MASPVKRFGWTAAWMLVVAPATPLSSAGQTTSPAAAPPPMASHGQATAGQVPAATVLLTGYGTGGFRVTTTSTDAQAYFDNGMQLAHAFAHRASIAAFRRAQELDPGCAMCVWGEAWARGPTINYPIGEARQSELATLADHAATLADGHPRKERALIAALQKRYHDGGGKGVGDLAFAQAMDSLVEEFPEDNEIAIIAADAWMIPPAQDNTRDHLDRAIQILERGLHRAPNNTGLIHFYIHATEMDGVAAEALAYAAKLPALAPAASHLVHMPSHTYFAVGRYLSAEKSNLAAVAIDSVNAARLNPPGGVFALGYHDHNVQTGEAAALIDGDATGGMALATAVLQRLPTIKSSGFLQQFGLGTAYAVFGRFASREDVESLPEPGESLPYAEAMWHYARGEVAARRDAVEIVKAEADKITISATDVGKFGDSSPQAQAMVDIAGLVLAGRAAMSEKRWSDAEASYRKAAEIQEAKLGVLTDPPGWWYPVRRSVAAALLARGDPTAAVVEIQQALARWPLDPQSLRILADSESAMGRKADADRHITQARANWIGNVATVPLSLL